MTTLLNINTLFCLNKQIKFSHAITELYVLQEHISLGT